MKKFENPVLEIEKLDILDVISTSCTTDCPDYKYDPDELPEL